MHAITILDWPGRPEMENSVKRGPKKVVVVGVRADDEWLRKLERWIAEIEPAMSRPEAIRRLVEIGLKAKAK